MVHNNKDIKVSKKTPQGNHNSAALVTATEVCNPPTRRASRCTFQIHCIWWILSRSFSLGRAFFFHEFSFASKFFFCVCDSYFEWTVCRIKILYQGCKHSDMTGPKWQQKLFWCCYYLQSTDSFTLNDHFAHLLKPEVEIDHNTCHPQILNKILVNWALRYIACQSSSTNAQNFSLFLSVCKADECSQWGLMNQHFLLFFVKKKKNHSYLFFPS